jgi:sn-glycerol 3-phosphate transport system substrate-binding protein
MLSRWMRHLTLTLVVLVLAVVPFAQAQAQVIVDFYYPTAVDGPITQVIQGYAQQFEAKHPNIKINPIYTGSYTQTRETIRTEIAAQDLIVDVAVMLATDLTSFVEEESIVRLQGFVDAMPEGEAFLDNFFPAFLLNSVDEEGTLWSIPFQRSTPILYYNADLFKAEGVEVPRNIDELIAVAQKLHTPERAGLLMPVAGGFPIWLYQSFAAGFGQPIVEADPATVYFNSEASLQAVEFLTKLGMSPADGGFGVGPMGGSVWGDTPTAFTSGQAAMIYHTTGSLTNILRNATFEVGVAFLPSAPANAEGIGYAAPTGGGNLYIFADADPAVQEAAWLWVQFLASDEIQSDWGANTGYIAATFGAWDIDPLKSLTEEKPQYAVARDQLAYAYKEFDSYRSIDVQNIINTTLSGIISGNTPLAQAQQALDTAQAQIDSLLAEYR